LPKEIYRYFTIDGAKWFLSNHSLKLTDPTKFNDPFEIKIDYKKSLITTGFRKPWEYCEDPMEADVLDLDNQLFETLSSYRVACFSQNDRDILMWAYYGEGHSGICFEFEPQKDLNFFNGMRKINYKANLESIKNYKGELFFEDVIWSKAKCWEHEHEWRVVKEPNEWRVFEGEKGIILWPINAQAITSVIFGCKMTDYRDVNDEKLKDYLEILELLKRSEYAHIKIKQVQMDSKEYKLQCAEVPFFVYEEQDGKITIVSLKDQEINIRDANKNVIYRAIMCKWEKFEIRLSKGIYLLYNEKDPSIQLKIL
jgi:hypothetical protein